MIAMFRSVEALDARRHGDLHYQGVAGYGFAQEVTSAPLAASEIAQAAREFPVVFSGSGKLLPVALLSVRKGDNPFVAEDGSWLADYVPAHIRRYPFVLGETGDDQRFVVMIDRAAPQFSAGDDAGQRLFAEDGTEPEDGIVARAKRFLARFQGELKRTEEMLRPLEEHGLLVERQFNINRGEHREVAVRGFRMVDAEKLAGLDDTVIGAWLRSGLLALVHAHLQSLGNAQRLLRRQPKPAPAPVEA